MTIKNRSATNEARTRMIGRIDFGIKAATKARNALLTDPVVGGQFRLDVGNAEEAFADVKQRFDNLSDE